MDILLRLRMLNHAQFQIDNRLLSQVTRTMTRFFLLQFLFVAMTSTVHLQAAAIESPVSITTELVANEKDNNFTLKVSLDIQDGWHTHDDSNNAGINTTVDLELPEGAKQVGEWARPLSKTKDGSREKKVFTTQADFSCEIAVSEDAIGKKIQVTVSYQACTEEYCNRPASKTLSVELKNLPATKKADLKSETKNSSSAKIDPAEKKTASKGAQKKISMEKNSSKFVFENELFEAPVRLTVNGKPLQQANDRFPSPAIYDIDNDGDNELIIGGLRGKVEVFENSSSSTTGDPIWEAGELLEDSDGKSIRLTNW